MIPMIFLMAMLTGTGVSRHATHRGQPHDGKTREKDQKESGRHGEGLKRGMEVVGQATASAKPENPCPPEKEDQGVPNCGQDAGQGIHVTKPD